MSLGVVHLAVAAFLLFTFVESSSRVSVPHRR
jgi:hypothetical protein